MSLTVTTGSNSSSSGAVPVTLTNAAGAYLLAFVSCDQSTLTVTPEGTWEVLYDSQLVNVDGQRYMVLKQDSGPGDTTYDWNFTAGTVYGASVAMLAVSGQAGASPTHAYDITISDSSASSPISLVHPSLETTVDGCLIVAAYVLDVTGGGGTTITEPAGYTRGEYLSSSANWAHCGFSYKIQATAGPTGTATTVATGESGARVTFTIAIAPAAGGGGNTIERAFLGVGGGSASGGRAVSATRAAQASGAALAIAAGSVSTSGSASGVGVAGGGGVALGVRSVTRSGAALASAAGSLVAVGQVAISRSGQACASAVGSGVGAVARSGVGAACSPGASGAAGLLAISRSAQACTSAAALGRGFTAASGVVNSYFPVLIPTGGGDEIENGSWNWANQSVGFRDVSASGSGEVVVLGYTVDGTDTKLWGCRVTSSFGLSQVYLAQLTAYNYGSMLLAGKQSSDGKLHVIYQDPNGLHYLRLALTYTSTVISGTTVEARFQIGESSTNSRADLDFQAGGDASQWVHIVRSSDALSNVEGIMFPRTATSAAAIVGWDGSATRTNLGAFVNGGHQQQQRIVALPSGDLLVLTGEIETELSASTMRRRLCTRSGATWLLGTLVTEPTFIGHMGGVSLVGSTVYRVAIGDSASPRIVFDAISSANAITYDVYPSIPVASGNWGGYAQISHSADGSRCYLASVDWGMFQRVGYYDGTWHIQTSVAADPISWSIGCGGVMWDRGVIAAVCNAYASPNNLYLMGVIDAATLTILRAFCSVGGGGAAALPAVAASRSGYATSQSAAVGTGSAGAAGAGVGVAGGGSVLTGAGASSVQRAGQATASGAVSGAPSTALDRSGLSTSAGALLGTGGLGAMRDGIGVAFGGSVLVGAGASSVQRGGLATSQGAAPASGQVARSGAGLSTSSGASIAVPSVTVTRSAVATSSAIVLGVGGSGEMRDGVGIAGGGSVLTGVGATSLARDGLAASGAALTGAGQLARSAVALATSAGASVASPSTSRLGQGVAASAGGLMGTGGIGAMRDGVGLAGGGSYLLGVGTSGITAVGAGVAGGGSAATAGGSTTIERGWVAVSSAWAVSVGATSVEREGLGFSASELLALGPTPLLVYLRSSVTIRTRQIFTVEIQTIGDEMPYVGETITRQIIVRDEDTGELFDPTELRVSLVLPDGSTDALLFGGGQSTDACLVHEAEGTFLLAYPAGTVDGDVTINAVIRHPYHGREIVRKLPLAHRVTINPDPVGYTDQPAPETP